ncbi:MAG: hypothetical protein IJP44_04795 [Bacteroidales bacterium]|nr:hypothetical protein [Bacteroidales bacterium]
MKKILVPLAASLLVALLSSCRHEVDLFGDYREIPVIYGLLDAKADTNFVKITRSFYTLGDAYPVAMNPDSSHYPGRLDVRLTEYCNGERIREIVLDTITIGNKQQGVFYAPKQKLYYTTEKLGHNTDSRKYSYMLAVALPDSTLHVKADLVGSNNFKVKSLAVNFSKQYFGTRRPFYFHSAVNAAYYEVEMAFTFKERRTPDSDSVPRTMRWKVGNYEDYYLANHTAEDGSYVFNYRPETFYSVLREFLGDDTLTDGVVRFIGDYPIELVISACGKNLRQYIYFNDPANSVNPGDPDFSLINGGLGVLSSRMTLCRKLRLGGETVPELMENRYWGFRFMGGDLKDGSTRPE